MRTITIMVFALLMLGCCGGTTPVPPDANDAAAPVCRANEVAPAEARTVSCDGRDIMVPAIIECTPIDRYIVDVIAMNPEVFAELSAAQAIQLYDQCLGAGAG